MACQLKLKRKEKTKIYQGSLRVIEHSNLAYVEPHKLVIKNNLYLFLTNMIIFVWMILVKYFET